MLVLAHYHCGMAHGASPAKQIHEVCALWHEAHNALRQFVFAPFVGKSVFHTIFVFVTICSFVFYQYDRVLPVHVVKAGPTVVSCGDSR